MTLADRIASAKAEETAGLLELLHLSFHETLKWPDYKLAHFHQLCFINTPESLMAAAMQLIPEGLVWKVMTDFELPGRATVYGSVLPGQIKDRGWSADGETPALALAAAIAQSEEL